MKDTNLGIGERIRNRRIELGLTQMDLALRMGYINKTSICKVEKGQDNITSDRVSKFAKALCTTEGYLMGWQDDPNHIPFLGDTPLQQSDAIAELTIKFMQLNDTNQRAVMTMIDSLLQNQ